ncbi:Uncharacterized protein EJ110_NYTH03250 [Nymphaea thermarum]|nr:Uncharacterized protein EJ110_NYTH03250 [Nymphaea thermarum]
MLSRFLKLIMSSPPPSSSSSRYAIAAAFFTKRFVSPCFFLPSALAALFFFLLLTCNALSIFCFQIPFPLKPILDRDRHLPQNAVVIEFGESLSSSSSSSSYYSSPSSSSSSSSLPSSIMYAVKEEAPLSRARKTLQLVHKHDTMVPPLKSSSRQRLRWFRMNRTKFTILQTSKLSRQFSARVQEFFEGAGGDGVVGNTTASSSSSSSDASPHPCELRVFMTWISSLDNFGDRGVFAIESLFKSNPDACLLIASKEMDSRRGYELLRPFWSRGYRVMAASPDLSFLFESTSAEVWFEKLRKGNVDPGEVPLGQNLSNLLRLALLYKYGGAYIDADVVVVKSFAGLRNTIGAQTRDEGTGRWSRLNNAVMIFDKNHPLVYKFIEEFALTFDGNKWGHNGPYLVSRVVSRVSGRPGFEFSVMPPIAFYPVDWSKVRCLFHGPRDKHQFKWVLAKLGRIKKDSFAVHLWNRHSSGLQVEDGSVVSHLMSSFCVLCNSTSFPKLPATEG